MSKIQTPSRRPSKFTPALSGLGLTPTGPVPSPPWTAFSLAMKNGTPVCHCGSKGPIWMAQNGRKWHTF